MIANIYEKLITRPKIFWVDLSLVLTKCPVLALQKLAKICRGATYHRSFLKSIRSFHNSEYACPFGVDSIGIFKSCHYKKSINGNKSKSLHSDIKGSAFLHIVHASWKGIKPIHKWWGYEGCITSQTVVKRYTTRQRDVLACISSLCAATQYLEKFVSNTEVLLSVSRTAGPKIKFLTTSHWSEIRHFLTF